MHKWLALASAALFACAGGGDFSDNAGPDAPGAPNGGASPANPSSPDAGAGAAADAASKPPPPSPGELALASPLPPQCTGPEIFRIERSVAKSSDSMGHFSYGYRFKAPTAPGAPVLVYVPGGPGMTSTDAPPTFLPSGWGYLLTNPRGAGCNTLAAVPSPDVSSAFFRSEEFAGDVVAAIQDRHLASYILYGLSYGTLLGTTVVHAIETQGLTRPLAVVLEGVMGRAFGANFTGADMIVTWDRVRSALPADVLTELDTKDSPFGLTTDTWSAAMPVALMGGPDLDTSVLALLSASDPSADIRKSVIDQIRSFSQERTLNGPLGIELFRQVACREIEDTSPASVLDVVFSHGKLVRNSAAEGTLCNGLHVTSPYDSAALQFETKAYYFIGDGNPATAPWQGAYHFDHHQGHAVRVVTHGAGHLSLQLNQSSCAPSVLQSIGRGGADLRAVLAWCPHPVDVVEK